MTIRSSRGFAVSVALVLLVGGLLRGVWLTSDPPVQPPVGVVWHDEGAWVHNARNKALWGTWRTDNWNPVFIAPVFTALEYASFRAFGVGTWQARTVPAASGLIAIAFLIAGLTAVADRRMALVGGALLAVNYASVMWNRAALMESTMTMFIVVSWGAYALARQRPWWGLVSGAAAVLAFFTKASAAFFVGALALEAMITIVLFARGRDQADRARPSGAIQTLAGLTIAGAVLLLVFVVPHWPEFRFYNWQMTVTRKPEYTLHALLMRASWLPLVHDFFTWMWPLFAIAAVSILQVASLLRARPHSAERVAALWVLVGLLELVVHDSGNERRYVMLIPALIALAVTGLGLAGVPVRKELSLRARLALSPILFALAYLAAGSLVRLAFLADVRAGHFHTTVVISLAAAALATVAALLSPRWGARLGLGYSGWPVPLALAAVLIPLAVDARHLAEWTAARTALNFEASREVGRLIAPGTLVQGKLANGLSLENRIRPIFIGHEFGNYDDRLQRDDVRYILTYVSPSVGFESQAGSGMIQELLDHYPHHRTIASFPVNETGGPDRAALVDKFPGPEPRAPD